MVPRTARTEDVSLSGNEEGAATPVEGPWLGGNIRSVDRQGRGEARALHIGDVGPYGEGLGRGGGKERSPLLVRGWKEEGAARKIEGAIFV